jgi:hypothetical protein
MQKIVAFALFSTRRQEEITLLRWDDLDGDRILVRDMKHPGDKIGNNVHCELPLGCNQRTRPVVRLLIGQRKYDFGTTGALDTAAKSLKQIRPRIGRLHHQ